MRDLYHWRQKAEQEAYYDLHGEIPSYPAARADPLEPPIPDWNDRTPEERILLDAWEENPLIALPGITYRLPFTDTLVIHLEAP